MDAINIAVIAGQEMRVTLRSKWVQIFAVLFAVLTLAIPYFGMVTSVAVGFEGFTRTTASILNLVLYLVPMFALAAGTLSFRIEKGAAELLFSQAVRRSQVLGGKILGLFSSLATAVVFGFGVSGVLIALQTGFEGISRYLSFVSLTLLLLHLLMSGGVGFSHLRRTRTHPRHCIGPVACLRSVLRFDRIRNRLAGQPHLAHTVILLSLLGNPVDVARVSGLLILGGATIFGAGGASLGRTFGIPALAIALLSSVALCSGASWFLL